MQLPVSSLKLMPQPVENHQHGHTRESTSRSFEVINQKKTFLWEVCCRRPIALLRWSSYAEQQFKNGTNTSCSLNGM